MSEIVDAPRPDHTSMDDIEIVILPVAAVDEMVHKIVQAAAHPGAAEAVVAWRSQHGHERWVDIGHDHCVVGGDLMYLHDAPDGIPVPHLCRPDGSEKMFTDATHVDALF